MDPEIISTDSTFEQLGIDSLDVVNIVFELENTFSIKLPDEFSLASLEDIDGVTQAIESMLDR
jgi:acyl carrier protein